MDKIDGGTKMTFWNVLIVILVIIAAALAALYFFGNKMQKKQREIKESGLPQMVIDQTPKYMRWSKIPVVKAKIGPKIMTLVADEKVFELIPVKKECKVVLSGIYITAIKSARGGLETPAPKKKGLFARFKK